MFACAPRLRSQPHDAAGTAASHPGCVVVLSPAEAKVDALPYRLRGTLLVVSGCCHVAAPVVIQVCYEPTKRRRKTFFKASKKRGDNLSFFMWEREIQDHTTGCPQSSSSILAGRLSERHGSVRTTRTKRDLYCHLSEGSGATIRCAHIITA